MKQNADPQIYKKCLGFLFNYLVDKKLKHLKKFVSKDEKGYDIGAGFGQYADRMNKTGYNVLAVEPDKRFIKECKTQHIVACGEELYKHKDYSYLFNVLHHSGNPVLLVKHLESITGKIIISELNRKNIFVWLYVNLFIQHESIKDHLSKQDVMKIVTCAEYKVIRSFSTGLLGVPFVYNWFILED